MMLMAHAPYAPKTRVDAVYQARHHSLRRIRFWGELKTTAKTPLLENCPLPGITGEAAFRFGSAHRISAVIGAAPS
jgi:hypothetical protein